MSSVKGDWVQMVCLIVGSDGMTGAVLDADGAVTDDEEDSSAAMVRNL